VANQDPHYIFSLLDPSLHHREAFFCGEASLDDYLKRQASQDTKRNLSRVHVMTTEDTPNVILGYYTLSIIQIMTTDLPAELQKALPPQRPIGATLLGRLALDNQFKGQGLGGVMLSDAFFKAFKVNESSIASAGVVIDALHDTAKQFYLHYGALVFPEQPLRLFVPMSTIKKRFEELGL
jgi:predicted GNAT family N-acyltransferase